MESTQQYPIHVGGAEFHEQDVFVDEGVSLRVMCRTPREPDCEDPLIFVAAGFR